MPAPAIAFAAVRVGAASAIAWKGLSEMSQLSEKASYYLEKHDTGLKTGEGHNDVGDAFRHAFASAKTTLQYGETTANVLGSLHEYHGNFKSQPEKECGMAMWNNKVGRDIARGLPAGASDEQIGKAVVEAIKRGELITSIEDPRTAKGLKELLSMDDLASKASTFLKESKTMLADITPGVIKEALASKDLSGPVMAGLAKGFSEMEKSFSPDFMKAMSRVEPDRVAAR